MTLKNEVVFPTIVVWYFYLGTQEEEKRAKKVLLRNFVKEPFEEL